MDCPHCQQFFDELIVLTAEGGRTIDSGCFGCLKNKYPEKFRDDREAVA